jgi:hypothetical protein
MYVMNRLGLKLVMSVLLSMVALNVSAEFDRWHKVKLGTGNLYYCTIDTSSEIQEFRSLEV